MSIVDLIGNSVIVFLAFAVVPIWIMLVIILSDIPKNEKREILRAVFIAPFLFFLMYLIFLIILGITRGY